MQIITRADAKAQGLGKYFTGKLCKNGHIAERRTNGGGCVECQAEAKKNPLHQPGGGEQRQMVRPTFTARSLAKNVGIPKNMSPLPNA